VGPRPNLRRVRVGPAVRAARSIERPFLALSVFICVDQWPVFFFLKAIPLSLTPSSFVASSVALFPSSKSRSQTPKRISPPSILPCSNNLAALPHPQLASLGSSPQANWKSQRHSHTKSKITRTKELTHMQKDQSPKPTSSPRPSHHTPARTPKNGTWKRGKTSSFFAPKSPGFFPKKGGAWLAGVYWESVG